MKKNEENCVPKEDVIEVSQIIDEINYTLKIYFAKDKQSIIFKIEPENIQMHYYYEKFYLLDLKRDYKRFNLMNNLSEIFKDIQIIINKYSTKIENEPPNKMKITIYNNSEIIAVFSLRKKILSQNRLNIVILDKIEENKNKIKSLKKLSTKLEKNMKTLNDMLNDIKSRVNTLEENLDNMTKQINAIDEKINSLMKKITEEENRRNKDIKNKKSENEEDDEIFSNKKKKKCRGEKISEILCISNIFIIILFAFMFLRIKSINQKEELESMKLNELKKKYTFIDVLKSLNEEDIKFVQHAFDSVNTEEEDEDENEDNDGIKKSNKDNKDESTYNDFRTRKKKQKKMRNAQKEGD